MKMTLSAVIIAKNEEKMLPECLDSLSWANEVILVDTGSSDKTVGLAKKYGARVFIDKYGKNFSSWRNFAVDKANGEWILFVDADERVTPLLRKEIEDKVNDPDSVMSAYAMPRRNILLGHEMRYGGWWPDYVLRLFKKSSFKGYVGKLHEQPKIEGGISKLKEPLVHITHRSLTEMIEKTNVWSETEAKLMYEAKHPKMNIIRFISAMFREFWYRGVVKLGFLDGPVGIIEIIYQTFSRFVSYAKLWEMQLEK